MTIGYVPQPTLHTARLTLVPLAEEHLELEIGLDADPEVMRFLTGRAMSRDEVTARHVERLAEGRVVDGLGFWAGSVGTEFAGLWILSPHVAPDGAVVAGEAELGYRLRRAWWRQGLASEGSRELLRHGFADVGLARVFAETMAVNAGSRAVLTAVGLRYVRTFDGGYDDPLPGAEHGEVEYAVTREEWQAQQAV